MGPLHRLVDTDPEFWGRVIDINYRGVLNTVLPAMIERGRGRVVSVASDAAAFITGRTLSVSGGLTMA